MTPKEKATDLLNRVSECGEDNEMYIETAKNCALFVVDEIVKIEKHHCHNLWVDYWLEVKTELEKL